MVKKGEKSCNNKEIVVFIGRMHSGKTTVAMLLDNTNFSLSPARFVKFAAPVYDTLDILRMKKTRGFMQEFCDLVKKYTNNNVFIDLARMKLEAWLPEQITLFGQLYVFDDVRYQTELDLILELAAKYEYRITIIGVNATEEVRRARSPETFLEGEHNSEKEVASLLKQCEFIIENNGTVDELEHIINQIVKELIDERS